MLDDISSAIKSGTITLKDLLVMKHKQENAHKLLAANTPEDKELKMALDEKFEECTLFLKRKDYLGQLCTNVDIAIEGMLF